MTFSIHADQEGGSKQDVHFAHLSLFRVRRFVWIPDSNVQMTSQRHKLLTNCTATIGPLGILVNGCDLNTIIFSW